MPKAIIDVLNTNILSIKTDITLPPRYLIIEVERAILFCNIHYRKLVIRDFGSYRLAVYENQSPGYAYRVSHATFRRTDKAWNHSLLASSVVDFLVKPTGIV